LCFEISESVAIANFVETKRLMKALDQLGVGLVLDDFGSGFSSLSYIRDLPLRYLKIDGNFVHNLVSSPVDAAMIKAVHEVGQVMNLYTIAELVEDGETLDQLRSIGINFAQGFYCGKPYPLLELCDLGIQPAMLARKVS
jgi:Amt family ammonium transporter